MKSKAALFRDHPLDGEIIIGCETLTTPYHIYDGTLLLIGGRVNGPVAQAMLAEQGLSPLLDTSGNAFAAVWIADFTDANLGPHHELQISLFAAESPRTALSTGRFALFEAFVARSQIQMVCHGLWNNTVRVVRYNYEHLGLDAKLTHSRIAQSGGRLEFSFLDPQGAPLADGNVGMPRHQPPGPLWSMARELGWRSLLNSIRVDYREVAVVSTQSDFASQKMVARTYSRPVRQTLRLFGQEDRIVIGHSRYTALNFSPDFVQQNMGVGFVYLRPEPWIGRSSPALSNLGLSTSA